MCRVVPYTYSHRRLECAQYSYLYSNALVARSEEKGTFGNLSNVRKGGKIVGRVYFSYIAAAKRSMSKGNGI